MKNNYTFKPQQAVPVTPRMKGYSWNVCIECHHATHNDNSVCDTCLLGKIVIPTLSPLQQIPNRKNSYIMWLDNRFFNQHKRVIKHPHSLQAAIEEYERDLPFDLDVKHIKYATVNPEEVMG